MFLISDILLKCNWCLNNCFSNPTRAISGHIFDIILQRYDSLELAKSRPILIASCSLLGLFPEA